MVFSELDDFRSLRRGKRNGAFRQVVRLPDLPPAPDSVVHQYRGENFRTDEWIDTAPSGPQADMSINGVSASTLNGARAASSDGVDDFGKTSTPGPESLPGQSDSFGVALVVRSSDKVDNTAFFGVSDSGGRFELLDFNPFDNSLGELFFVIQDQNSNNLIVETDITTDVVDGDTHLICINKPNNDASQIDIFVDNMKTPQPATTIRNQAFKENDYTTSSDMGFFASNDISSRGGITGEKDISMSFIEFSEEPYSKQDRLDLKQRAPGL
jgi:hypothetical protein